MLRKLLKWRIIIADTIFWDLVKYSSQVYLVIAGTDIFCGKMKLNCYLIFKCFYLTHISAFTFSEMYFYHLSLAALSKQAKFAKFTSPENYLETSM